MLLKEFMQKYGTNTTTNFQLIQWAKDLNIKPFYYCMRDEIVLLKDEHPKYYAITNIHTTKQKGIHHSALFKDNKQLYFFDSYGLDPTKEILNLDLPIICSTFQIQNIGTKYCGQLSLWVLYQLSLGKKFEEIIINLI